MTYDVCILGLGAAGSAAACHLARRGLRVLGLDRYAPPHAYGSTHGESRIIRQAYFEGALYVPLLRRAYALWAALEAEQEAPLMRLTGGLMMGPSGSPALHGARQSAEAHGVPHEMLPAADLRRRFPAFHLPDGHTALYEPGAGYLDPEACVRAHLTDARRHGATLKQEEPALAWHPDGDGVQVTTARGRYRAGCLVVCAGGWMPSLVPDLALPLTVERQVNGWFEPAPGPKGGPVYIWEHAPGAMLYGFPDLGRGAKAGLHRGGTTHDHPDAVDRRTTPADEAALAAPLRRLLPGLGACRRMQTCFYTNTPDHRYLIDRHPRHPQVLLAGGFSGHGFKASAAVGEALAEMATEGAPRLDLGAFALARHP